MKTTNKIKVFLVDDDKMFIHALKHSLTKSNDNLEISTFNTGEECIKYVKTKPDLIILDYNLDGEKVDAMDGMTTLNKIKEKSPDTEVIMLSAQDSVEVAMSTLRNEAYDYVVKGETCFIKIQNIVNRFSEEVTMYATYDDRALKEKFVYLAFFLMFLLLFLVGHFLS